MAIFRFSLAVTLLLFGSTGNRAAQSGYPWTGTWASAQQIPESNNVLPPDDLRDATLRQFVHVSIGGDLLRIRLSNAFGSAPLHLSSVHVARPVSSSLAAIQPGTDKPVLFSGRDDVILPARAEYLSDPLEYPLPASSDLAISIHYNDPPEQETGHPGSRTTSYIAHGDLVSAVDLPNAKKVDHWYQVSGVDVRTTAKAFSIDCLGDSITDGHGATTNGNDRWPDDLARRLQNAGMRKVGVLNEGIGGNRLLLDGLGPNALARFDRDVLAQAGIQYLIVLEGVNDLGMLTHAGEVSAAEHAALVQQIIAAYEQIIARSHIHHIRVAGGTIMPYVGSSFYHPDPANEADRQAVNAWIRTPGHFDIVIDFDKAMRDPAHRDRLLPAFDSGDHLHPSPAGYAAMAQAIPLQIFRSR